MEEQLAELQVLFMDQLQNMETMSEQLIAHSKRLNELEDKFSLLESKINQVLELSTEMLEVIDEVPPHY